MYNRASSKDDSGPSLTGRRLPTNGLVFVEPKLTDYSEGGKVEIKR